MSDCNWFVFSRAAVPSLALAVLIQGLTCAADTTASKSAKSTSAKKPAVASSKTAAAEAAGARRLPDSALKKAQLAEKELAADKPLEAIALLNQIDRDHPNFSAVSLRIAQVYDQLDQPGAALHYYRRYVQLAAGRVREEAAVRVQALELMPDAKSDADEFARNLGQIVAPVPTPTPDVRLEIAAAREDGSLVPIHGSEELQRMARTGLPPQEPVTATPTPLLLPDNRAVFDAPSLSAPAATPARATSNEAPLEISVPLTRSQTVLPPIVAATPLVTAAPTRPAATAAPTRASAKTQVAAPSVKASVYAGTTPPSAADEDSILAQSFATGQPPPSAQTAELTPALQSTAGDPLPRLSGPRAAMPGATQRTPAAHAGKRGSVAYTSPTPETKVVSPRASGFFVQKSVPGSNASIKITNAITDSVVTFAIIPEDDGEPINAILANGESRSFQIPPGNHEVSVNIATSNYPPLNLMDVRFEYQFQAGTQYTRRLTLDGLQQVQ